MCSFRGSLRALFLAILCTVALNLTVFANARRHYDLPAGDAAQTLKLFSEQSGEQIVYPVEQVRGQQTNAVRGELTTREALDAMLAKTGLMAVQDEKTGALAVKRVADVTSSKPSGRAQDDFKPGTSNGGEQKGNNEGEVLTLSPFIVSGVKDSGYQATSSLGGTRINTRLQEIPASISVVTKDMMNDLGASNSALLLTYTLGTEVSGPSGSFSGASVNPGELAQDGVNRGLQPQIRIRGLANADSTRDFFQTSIPWDGFNTERIEVNRGPNAMLYGTGSPAGIVNQTTNKAEFNKNSTDIILDYGSFGSTRAVVNSNVVLIKDQLAIRADLKKSDQQFMQEEAYIADKRGFVAGTFKPFELTTIRANYEQGRQSSVKPQWRPPFELGIESWFALGKPSYNPITGVTTLTGPVTARVSAVNADGSTNGKLIQGGFSGAFSSDNPTLIFNSAGTLYGLNATSGLTAFTNRGPGDISMKGLPGSRQYQIEQHAGMVGGGAWNEQQISNPKIFDFYRHLLEGSNKPEGAKWAVAAVTLEQLLPDHSGGIEIALNKERLHTSFNNPFNWQTYGIGVDINSRLLDGSVNPNYGRPVIASDSWSTETKSSRQENRVTGFYSWSLKNEGPQWLRKLVGAHTVTANYSDATWRSLTHGGRALAAGPDYAFINPNIATHLWSGDTSNLTITNGAARGVQALAYLGNSLANASNAVGASISPVSANVLIPGVPAVPVLFYNPNTSAWQTTGVTINQGSEFDKSIVNLGWTGGEVKTKATSKTVILHSVMLNEMLVPTVGYRDNELKSYNAKGDYLNASKTGELKSPLPQSPSSVQSDQAFNYGAVLRLSAAQQAKIPYGLAPSVFYNKSDNFSPSGQRLDIFGNPIDTAKGKTKEYGFMLSALDGKLALRLTHFNTSLTGVSMDRRDAIHALVRDGLAAAITPSTAVTGNASQDAARAAFASWFANSPVAANLKRTFGPTLVGNQDGIVLQTKDSVSTGNELELTYNPTSNWRVALNASKSQVVNKNIASDAVLLLSQIKPMLDSQAGQIWINQSTQRTLQTGTNAWVQSVKSDQYGEGQSVNPELRQYRFNAMTNYTFTDGALKNFAVGGAIRWASKVLIGTGYKTDALLGDVPNYGALYYGPSEATYDSWVSYTRPNIFRKIDWMVQLNVRNIGVGKKLIPTVAQPDGSIAQWRIAEPMTVTLSSKFSF